MHFLIIISCRDGVTKEYVELVSGCLTFDLNQRYTFEKIINHPWMTMNLDIVDEPQPVPAS